jgi:hypothetical protein
MPELFRVVEQVCKPDSVIDGPFLTSTNPAQFSRLVRIGREEAQSPSVANALHRLRAFMMPPYSS